MSFDIHNKEEREKRLTELRVIEKERKLTFEEILEKINCQFYECLKKLAEWD